MIIRKALGFLVLALLFSAPTWAQNMNAAGASGPYPIYSKWFDDYHKQHPMIQINYQSIGSGGGISQLIAHTVDFGASDGPMTDDQIKQAGGQILHFPTVVVAAVPTYNVPGVSTDLKFTGDSLAGIYLGKITKWNDPAIASVNPGVKLPNDDIVVVHRSDGSGTTYIWSDYLSQISPEWKSKVGKNTALNWPVGLGGKGSEGVAGLVKQTPDSIGYIELTYALQNGLTYGLVKNQAGEFIKATLPAVSAAAAGAATTMPADFRVSIVNAPGKESYPISSFTWLLIPSTITDSAKREAVKDFLGWMMTGAQGYCEGLQYAPLPKQVVAKEKAYLAMIK